MPDKSVRVVIEGRVQGVWYRGWTVEQAQQRGIRGWIRNLPNGNVEALFSGSDLAVDEMINVCRGGPPMANVISLSEHPAEPPDGEGFHSLRSGV
ncbi:MAG: acylphosphatase [Alphaproteobacteria bacterium]|jgi:acylphosphatase|nr:acylphosphatase [Alphaproteobacteria bacterium]MBT7942547.1 acylphosphatase [Alphaproteobacteria bacterium]